MKELALHVLDIAKNSVAAGAKKIAISIEKNTEADSLCITVTDDGCGMDEDFAARALDPFTTTRTTRKVGMGLPLFRQAAEDTGGSLNLYSQKGTGTVVSARFGLSHIDRAPAGDMAGTICTLVQGNPEIRFIYTVRSDGEDFTFDTADVQAQLGDVPVDTPEVLAWIRDYLYENERID